MSRAAKVAEFLREHRARPFAWGTWDCAQSCAEWVQRATGTDHRASFAAYRDESEAEAIIAAHGSLAALVDTRFVRIHPSRARVGDLVLAAHDLALGICIGVQSAHVGPSGWVYRKTLDAVCAWRVE